MRIVDLSDFDAAVRLAAEQIALGAAIIYPTDTVYALGVDAASPRAIAAAYAAKSRSSAKPLSLCVADLEQARQCVAIDAQFEVLAQRFLPGPLTLVCASLGKLPPEVQAGFPGIGIRIPGHAFGPALARAVGHPITTTSANTSGRPPAIDRASAETAFADADEQPALLIDGGASPLARASTVVDLTGAEPKLIRAGAIGFDDIVAALRQAGVG